MWFGVGAKLDVVLSGQSSQALEDVWEFLLYVLG